MTPLSFDYPISILILYSDWEPENETQLQMDKALRQEGHVLRLFKVTKKNWKESVKVPGEIVFNLIDDPGWELWGKVFTLFDKMGRQQLGIDKKSFFYSMSKTRMKRKLRLHNLPTPDFRVLNKRSNLQIRGLEYPLIIKPSEQHASEGISQDSVVIDEKELKERTQYLLNKFGSEVLAEQFVDGRELHVTVMGNGRHLIVLPHAEIMFKGEYQDNWNVFTYEAKWKSDSWEYWDSPIVCPAPLKRKTEQAIDEVVKKAYRALGCRDIARFDIRIDEKGKPYIIDLNLLPDLSNDEETESWRSAEALGWTYPQFIETVVAIAYKRAYGRMPDRLRERRLLLQAGV